jgi:hypothetical protein
MPLKESPPGEVGAGHTPAAGHTTNTLIELRPQSSGSAPWEALRGVFPTCTRCGSRVQHYSVLVCFHCVSPPEREKPADIPGDIHCDRCGWVILCPHTWPWITVRGPGRCTRCSFHVATQGHREWCSGTAPVQSDEPEWTSRAYWLDVLRDRNSA